MQRDRDAVVASRARVRANDIEDLHIHAGIVALTGSHMRLLEVGQFRAPCSI